MIKKLDYYPHSMLFLISSLSLLLYLTVELSSLVLSSFKIKAAATLGISHVAAAQAVLLRVCMCLICQDVRTEES